MTADTEIQLRLPAVPENVALVRQVVSGIGDALEADAALVADIKTAVTEACNNVVLHAYPDDRGTLEVDANPGQELLTITVRDTGGGMQPRSVEPEEASLGLGLPLIAALSDRFEIHGGGDRGIEVRMIFVLADGAIAEPDGAVSAHAPEPPTDRSMTAAGVSITPGPMMGPVLGRLMAMLAARADFSLEKLSDAVLVTDAISESIDSYIPGRHAVVTFEDGSHKIDMRVGPLVEGGGEKLIRTMELPGLEQSLERLVDEFKVESADDRGEYVLVRLTSKG